MKVLNKIADSIDDMLKFTIDFPSKYEDKRMPVLDLKVWLENDNTVNYIFYEKPMKSNFVIDKLSALPYSMKMKSLTQEVFRRLHNTNEKILEENKSEILSKFTQKLKNSGYNEKERLNIVKGGMKTYDNLK